MEITTTILYNRIVRETSGGGTVYSVALFLYNLICWIPILARQEPLRGAARAPKSQPGNGYL